MTARPPPEDDDLDHKKDMDHSESRNNNHSSFHQPNYTNNSTPCQQKNLTNDEVEKLIAEYNIKKQEESWIRIYWRPAMGWLYMVICAFDFIIFPLMAMFFPVIAKMSGFSAEPAAWVSLTLSNGGLIHMAFGAILGVAAWSRGQEKIKCMSNFQ